MTIAPPPLSHDSKLGEASDSWLEVRCGCGASSFQPCRMLAHRYSPSVRLRDVLARLKCRRCQSKPVSVALIERADGSAQWRLQLTVEP